MSRGVWECVSMCDTRWFFHAFYRWGSSFL